MPVTNESAIESLGFSSRMLHFLRRPYAPFVINLQYDGWKDAAQWRAFMGEEYAFKDVLVLEGEYYFPEYHLKDFASRLAERFMQEPDFIQRVVDSTERTGTTLQRVALDIQTTHYASGGFSRERLLSDLHRYANAYAAYMPALGIFSSVDSLEHHLRTVLARTFSTPDEVKRAYDTLTLPAKMNYYKQEARALLELAANVEQDGGNTQTPAVQAALEKHVEQFGWLGVRYGTLDAWTVSDARERLDKLLAATPKPREALNAAREEDDRHAKALEQVKNALSPQDRHVVTVIQEFIYYRTHRTDVMGQTFYHIRGLLNALAASFSVTYEQLIFCTTAEVFNQQLPPAGSIDERIRAFGFIGPNGKPARLIVGNELKEVQALVAALDAKTQTTGNPQGLTELKGVTACQGVAQGPCRIVRDKTDFGKVQPGDVLVTTMTTPEMIVLMQKACAFVTDEGGITCHAAIVSREMNKPCVIATKRATKTLHDGEVVEVDATQGVVRKIKKN